MGFISRNVFNEPQGLIKNVLVMSPVTDEIQIKMSDENQT